MTLTYRVTAEVAFFGQVVAPGGDLARGDGTLRGYGAREQTRTGHLREVAGYLSWRTVDGPRWKDLEEFLFARS